MTDASTAVAIAPLVQDLKPYIDLTAQLVITGFIGLGFALLRKYTGIAVNAQAVASLKSAAATQAGILIAGAEDNLAKQTVTVKSPIVASAAAAIEAELPEAMKAAGATPENLQAFVAGEIGKLQAQATAVAGSPAPDSSKT